MNSCNKNLEIFIAKQRELKEFLSDHEEFTEVFLQLVEQYNSARSDLVTAIRATESSDSVHRGPFSRTARGTAGQYSPADLPSKVLAIPGVIKKNGIDAKVVNTLLESGSITKKDVKNACVEVDVTPKVYGPKERQILL